MGKKDWIARKTLAQCKLTKEGMLILGIHRDDGSYVGVPRGETQIYPGDTLVIYDREKAAQARQEMNYEQKRGNNKRTRG